MLRYHVIDTKKTSIAKNYQKNFLYRSEMIEYLQHEINFPL